MESPFDINTVIGVAIATLISMVLRWFRRSKFWESISAKARAKLDDPRVPIDDPRQATEEALLDAQRDKVEQVARKISHSIPPTNKESK